MNLFEVEINLNLKIKEIAIPSALTISSLYQAVCTFDTSAIQSCAEERIRTSTGFPTRS